MKATHHRNHNEILLLPAEVLAERYLCKEFKELIKLEPLTDFIFDAMQALMLDFAMIEEYYYAACLRDELSRRQVPIPIK